MSLRRSIEIRTALRTFAAATFPPTYAVYEILTVLA
jgi:hypothetical protein